MRALVVDDSKAMRVYIRNILVDIGYEVIEAGHGNAALAQLTTFGATDLALVDWNMPEMNGFEFVQRVRRQAIYDAMRIVMVTTEAEMGQMTKALEAGANDYLMKPFTAELMREKLSRAGEP